MESVEEKTRYEERASRVLPCGCAAAYSHKRTRCEEAKKLRREWKRLMKRETEASKLHGPTSPARHDIMAMRLAVQRELDGHLGRRA